MVSNFVKTRMAWVTDKIGDGFLYVLDEGKFWGEVVTEFLELDESSSDRHLNEMRQQVREQMDETEQYQKEVDKIKAQRKRMGIKDNNNDDGSQSSSSADESDGA
jgi:hypothetical protein